MAFTGAQLSIGGIDPNLISPTIFTYVGSVQHDLPWGIVASAGYTGSNAINLIDGSYVNQFPGTDVNRVAGDLVVHNNVLTRLNPSFGSVTYTTNIPGSRYNALILTGEKRLPAGGRITASYTRSAPGIMASNIPIKMTFFSIGSLRSSTCLTGSRSRAFGIYQLQQPLVAAWRR